jgi:hypothetical protein
VNRDFDAAPCDVSIVIPAYTEEKAIGTDSAHGAVHDLLDGDLRINQSVDVTREIVQDGMLFHSALELAVFLAKLPGLNRGAACFPIEGETKSFSEHGGLSGKVVRAFRGVPRGDSPPWEYPTGAPASAPPPFGE